MTGSCCASRWLGLRTTARHRSGGRGGNRDDGQLVHLPYALGPDLILDPLSRVRWRRTGVGPPVKETVVSRLESVMVTKSREASRGGQSCGVTGVMTVQPYIGTKIIHAEPMEKHTACTKNLVRDNDAVIDETGHSEAGYHVVYPDGYESWSPQATFEAAYRLVTTEERGLLNTAEDEAPAET